MNLLANENIPAAAVEVLRSRGHDVLWVLETHRGMKDPLVLAAAKIDNRLLLTFDKDFGELVFRRGLAASPGVVLFRISTRSSQEATDRIVAVLERHSEWTGFFSVVEDDRIRQVRMPATEGQRP